VRDLLPRWICRRVWWSWASSWCRPRSSPASLVASPRTAPLSRTAPARSWWWWWWWWWRIWSDILNTRPVGNTILLQSAGPCSLISEHWVTNSRALHFSLVSHWVLTNRWLNCEIDASCKLICLKVSKKLTSTKIINFSNYVRHVRHGTHMHRRRHHMAAPCL